MKFLQTLAATAMLVATGAEACIRVHINMVNNAIAGDTVTAQVWDDDVMYCKGVGSKYMASDQTHYAISCVSADQTYDLDIWNNARQGTVDIKKGGNSIWHRDLGMENIKTSKECIMSNDQGCKMWGLNYETCLDDRAGNCASYSCDLCDGTDCPE